MQALQPPYGDPALKEKIWKLHIRTKLKHFVAYLINMLVLSEHIILHLVNIQGQQSISSQQNLFSSWLLWNIWKSRNLFIFRKRKI